MTVMRSSEEQCLDVCFLLKCSLEPPGEDRDNCETMCQTSCDSEATLQESSEGKNPPISTDECDDHVTQLLFFYGGSFRNEIVSEHCKKSNKSRRR